jgi:hypothetical protein
LKTQTPTLHILMNLKKSTPLIAAMCGCIAAASSSAGTIPAGTTIPVRTVSLITSQDAVGSSFEAKIAQDVSVKGGVLRKSEPLTVELTSVSVNGRNVAIKTNSMEPHGPPQSARQAVYGHTAGTTVVNPQTLLHFQLLQAVTF